MIPMLLNGTVIDTKIENKISKQNILDSKLSWKRQLVATTKKALRALMICIGESQEPPGVVNLQRSDGCTDGSSNYHLRFYCLEHTTNSAELILDKVKILEL